MGNVHPNGAPQGLIKLPKGLAGASGMSGGRGIYKRMSGPASIQSAMALCSYRLVRPLSAPT